MLKQYFVNTLAQPNGDHEVHREGCSWMPLSRQSVGYHASCYPAVQAARMYYSRADGCAHCSPQCHTR
ncbi:hypothetical protein SAMN05216589_0226 [Halopseudomonas bauzanensis]|uniref:Uncharacterized protein n=1 Tax=Halopseudomonas bauzanensis TaxID=653930 RepID=A0A1I4KTX6_9GAMM|nr:hypothetical protein SAMN05216589_0226 [Halopseudomonas bauzanensis]SFL82262.1 hypothetical protein SAMN04487855_1398 [Halopseudomonas bauzanensis]